MDSLNTPNVNKDRQIIEISKENDRGRVGKIMKETKQKIFIFISCDIDSALAKFETDDELVKQVATNKIAKKWQDLTNVGMSEDGMHQTESRRQRLELFTPTEEQLFTFGNQNKGAVSNEKRISIEKWRSLGNDNDIVIIPLANSGGSKSLIDAMVSPTLRPEDVLANRIGVSPQKKIDPIPVYLKAKGVNTSKDRVIFEGFGDGDSDMDYIDDLRKLGIEANFTLYTEHAQRGLETKARKSGHKIAETWQELDQIITSRILIEIAKIKQKKSKYAA